MKMRIDFGDFVTDCVRILVLLNSVTMRKSIKLTESKIKLYDFYFKFPNTMIEETELSRSEKNFDEYYAFFHWKPDVIRYRTELDYLVSKGLAAVLVKGDDKIYEITDIGIEVLQRIESSYKDGLIKLGEVIVPILSKMSDTKIEQLIIEKNDMLQREGWIKSE